LRRLNHDLHLDPEAARAGVICRFAYGISFHLLEIPIDDPQEKQRFLDMARTELFSGEVPVAIKKYNTLLLNGEAG
jgi:hypothetical protein